MKNKFLLLGIILLAIFMRFYRLSNLLHWTMDEEYWSYIPFNIATGYHFPLIGGSMAGTGLYTGPLFVYLMAVPTKIFGGNPLGFGVTVSTVGVLATILIFFLGKKIGGQRVGYLATALYAGSFLMTIVDRHYWNASLTPILSLLVLFCLYKIIQTKKYFWSIPLSFVLALAFHSHGTGMALILFTLVAWAIYRVTVKNKWVILAIMVFFALQTPLIAFDLRHNFLNTRAAANYLITPRVNSTSMGERVYSITTGFINAGSRLIYFPATDIALEQTLGLNDVYANQKGKPPLWATVVFIVAIGLSLFEQKKSLGIKLCLTLIGATLAGLLIYKDSIPEYYFNPAFGPVFLLLAWQLAKLPKPLIVACLVIFLALNLHNILVVKHSFNYDGRIKAVQEAILKVSGQPFEVNAACRGFCQLYGFRYLFTYLRDEPVSSYMDPEFSWLYEKRLPKGKPTQEVIFNMHDDQIDVQLLPK